MRQLVGLLRVIDKAEMTEHYFNVLAHAQATGVKLNVSLEDFLSVTLKEEKPAAFDPEMDEKLSAYMANRVKGLQDGRQ